MGKKRPCTTPLPPTCSECEDPVERLNECGCLTMHCKKRPCATQPPVTCDPVCDKLTNNKDQCGCSTSSCEPILCKEPIMPECGPCQEVKNKTDQCGCLHLECVPKKCPVIDVTCGECEKQVEVKDGCGCKVVSCIPLITTDKCVVNGVAHPINSTWPNEFDPKCSKCRCVAEGKCLGAKIECEDVAKKDCLVFCKEGEWYYPPSKEQCENTCGPCCGKCGPAKCNAESGLVPADKTVEILKTTKKGKIPIKCVNKKDSRTAPLLGRLRTRSHRRMDAWTKRQLLQMLQTFGNWEKGGEDDVWGWNEFPPSGGQSNSLRLSTLWKRSWRKKINSRTRPNRNWNYIRGHRQYIPKDLNYICKIIHVTVLIFHVSIYDVHPKVIIWSESKLSQSSLFHLGVL